MHIHPARPPQNKNADARWKGPEQHRLTVTLCNPTTAVWITSECLVRRTVLKERNTRHTNAAIFPMKGVSFICCRIRQGTDTRLYRQGCGAFSVPPNIDNCVRTYHRYVRTSPPSPPPSTLSLSPTCVHSGYKCRDRWYINMKINRALKFRSDWYILVHGTPELPHEALRGPTALPCSAPRGETAKRKTN